MKVLILGGYGMFGSRLVELICDRPTLNILVCGRRLNQAQKLCERLKDRPATLTPLAFDRADIEKILPLHQPDLLVDASGPFQIYGDDPYHIVKACIAHGVHYLDLADDSQFVRHISKFDTAAKKAGLSILSGASSYPAISGAVLENMAQHMTIKSVKSGIAPSPFANISLSVIRAILSYAGSPVDIVKNGQRTHATGLVDTQRYTIAPPGVLPLRNRHFSLVDVPEHWLLPDTYPSIETVWMGAGPIPEYLHKLLNGLARIRALFRLPSLEFLASVTHRVLRLLRSGPHRGGMFIEVSGDRTKAPNTPSQNKDSSQTSSLTRSWHLIAEGDHGPYIPAMVPAALIRKWGLGAQSQSGARAAIHAVTLSELESLFKERDIVTGIREIDSSDLPTSDTPTSLTYRPSLFQILLGTAFKTLPTPIKALHQSGACPQWVGRAEVFQGQNPLARLIANIVNFPKPANAVPLRFSLTQNEEEEIWTRQFGHHTFSTILSAGTGRSAFLLNERFGLLNFGIALVIRDQQLAYIPYRWSLGKCPLPRGLIPIGTTFESAPDGRFHFDVTIKAPLIGLIVHYKGWLVPDPSKDTSAPS